MGIEFQDFTAEILYFPKHLVADGAQGKECTSSL